jgi:hypothetical protein
MSDTRIDEIISLFSRPRTEDIITELFTLYPDLDEVCIWGYTPGFNDGNPCYHRGDWYIRWKGLRFGGGDCVYFQVESVEEGYASKIIEDEDEDATLTSVDVPPKLMTALSTMSDYFEHDYGTDSVCIFARQNGKVNFHSCSYDCGY